VKNEGEYTQTGFNVAAMVTATADTDPVKILRPLTLLLAQSLKAATYIFPEVVPTVTVMAVVPWPAVIEEPGGTLQL
jgi:hypothetical protein